MPTIVIVVLSLAAIVVLIWPVMRSLLNPERRYLIQVYEGVELVWELPIRGSHEEVCAEIKDAKARVTGSQRYVLRRYFPDGWKEVERSPLLAPVRT